MSDLNKKRRKAERETDSLIISSPRPAPDSNKAVVGEKCCVMHALCDGNVKNDLDAASSSVARLF